MYTTPLYCTKYTIHIQSYSVDESQEPVVEATYREDEALSSAVVPRCSGGSWISKQNLKGLNIMHRFQQLKASRLNMGSTHNQLLPPHLLLVVVGGVVLVLLVVVALLLVVVGGVVLLGVVAEV